MKYSEQVLFSYNVVLDDEIDNLFNKLEQIEPPPSLVENILASVARLSQLPSLSPLLWSDSQELVVHNENCEPS